MQQLIINFTPTGMVPTKTQTPHAPISPNEIIEQVHEANEIGITLVHLHARDKMVFLPIKLTFIETSLKESENIVLSW